MTIRSTRGKIAKALFAGERPKALPTQLMRPAQRKLTLLDAAARPQDMGVVPADRLKRIREASGDERWQVRLNSRWRLRFTWSDGDAHDVEIADFHD